MRINILILGLFSLLLVGCGALRPISSKPPASAIVLKEPAKTSLFLLTTLTFPAGEYRPLYEDNSGYYYQAPTKVIGNNLGTYMYDGGFYVKRNTAEPMQWYIIDPRYAEPRTGSFKTVPDHTLVP